MHCDSRSVRPPVPFIALCGLGLVLSGCSILGNRSHGIEVQLPCGSDLIVNGSFETGGFVSDGRGFMALPNESTAIDGWTVRIERGGNTSANNLVWLTTPNSAGIAAPTLPPPEGNKMFLNLAGSKISSFEPYPSINQSLTVEPGTYELGFYLGSEPVPISVDVTTTLNDLPSSIVTVTQGASPPVASWQLQHFDVVVPFGGTLSIRFNTTPKTAPGSNGVFFVGLDKVTLKRLKPVGSCINGL
jgi:hypothetical protein